MMRLITLCTVMALLTPTAGAEPSSAVAFDSATLKLLADADPARGEELAKTGKCSKCHGDAGISEDPEDINIAGMSSSYIFKQLKDYLDKKRDSRDMYKSVRNLDARQLADLAVWYASLAPAQPAPDRNMDRAVLRLVFKGDPERMIKACASCHGRNGRGGQFDHPALAGQHREYLVLSMNEFREGDRENDIYARMRNIAEALTEKEIEGLAAYYATVVPDEAQ
ncbi:MAG: c-type cytochrome [Gammaproteobacteria bacterium]|nr:c-type cytochrome [Gammaproteobacteria bacterium]